MNTIDTDSSTLEYIKEKYGKELSHKVVDIQFKGKENHNKIAIFKDPTDEQLKTLLCVMRDGTAIGIEGKDEKAIEMATSFQDDDYTLLSVSKKNEDVIFVYKQIEHLS